MNDQGEKLMKCAIYHFFDILLLEKFIKIIRVLTRIAEVMFFSSTNLEQIRPISIISWSKFHCFTQSGDFFG
jgi:hypothetical protein